jgi:hypothetical protein
MATLSASSHVFLSRAGAAYGASDRTGSSSFNCSKWSGRPVLHELVPQPLHHSIQHRERQRRSSTLGRPIVHGLYALRVCHVWESTSILEHRRQMPSNHLVVCPWRNRMLRCSRMMFRMEHVLSSLAYFRQV